MWDKALGAGYVHCSGESRDTDTKGEDIAAKLFADATVVSSYVATGKSDIIYSRDGMLVRLWWYRQFPEVGWEVAGSDVLAVRAFAEEINVMAPRIAHDEENIVPVKFWALDSMGNPNSQTRKIEINPWAVIANNYPNNVRGHLQEMIDLQRPTEGGKLILWHGLPGTGKTHFLRSLAYAWREWCDVSYIVDPDEMFSRAYYLLNCVLHNDSGERWHLIVLEDSGEFMVDDAGHRTGQGLSRLLNLTDGLVGQGLKLLVLMTTNEKVSKLHPAVNRPGRCLAEIAFTSFMHKEALMWCKQHDVPLATDKPGEVTLADLYECVATAHIANDLGQRVSTGQYV